MVPAERNKLEILNGQQKKNTAVCFRRICNDSGSTFGYQHFFSGVVSGFVWKKTVAETGLQSVFAGCFIWIDCRRNLDWSAAGKYSVQKTAVFVACLCAGGSFKFLKAQYYFFVVLFCLDGALHCGKNKERRNSKDRKTFFESNRFLEIGLTVGSSADGSDCTDRTDADLSGLAVRADGRKGKAGKQGSDRDFGWFCSGAV